MDEKLIEIQEMLMRGMKRLDDDKVMKENINMEISRTNALSNAALTYVKTINVNLRLIEIAEKQQKTRDAIKGKVDIND